MLWDKLLSMHVRRCSNAVLFVIVLASGVRNEGLAQSTMHRQTAPSETMDSSGHPRTVNGPPANDKVVRGTIVLPDGLASDELVGVYSDCGGVQTLMAVVDTKSHYAFNSDSLLATNQTKSCSIYASLRGYRSSVIEAPKISAKGHAKLSALVLKPLAASSAGLVSATDGQVNKGEKRKFEKALNEAAATNWAAAIESFKQITSANQDYTAAWLSLGILQRVTGDRKGAQISFAAAIRSEPKYAPPFVDAAALEAVQGAWQKALAYSQTAIDLNAAAFPEAYSWNAIADLNLQKLDAAEKSAREGLKLDTAHRYAELEYALGLVLESKGDSKGSAEHLQAYLEQAPNGSNAASARSELAQLKSSAEPIAASSDMSKPVMSAPAASGGPALSALQERNSPLLVNMPSHTCLESINRAQIDERGKTHDPELLRVEVAISGDQEIYGDAGGKKFSSEKAAEILGYSFSSTGLFSSLARAVIAGTTVTVSFEGSDVLNQEPVFRYRFRVLQGQTGWSIQYGKESGVAGEEGLFFVDRASLTLRRVVVHTIDIPHSLKLKALQAVIDYAPETIASRLVLLPYRAEVRAEERNGTERVSRMSFDHCRTFSAESSISFDVEGKQEQHKDGDKRVGLPENLEVTVSLPSTISEASAAADDLLTASVTEPVFFRGREFIARGSQVKGHVRPDRGDNAVVIEFDQVKTRSGWTPFYARLISPVGQSVPSDPFVPGVATVRLVGNHEQLAAGTRLTWRTESIEVAKKTGAPQLNTSVGLQ